MADQISIRQEQTGDVEQIREINLAAFEGTEEADLVDRLRVSCGEAVSLVAVSADRVVGHILFSPVVLVDPQAQHPGMGLAPMSVLPEFQRQGIGSLLVQTGLEELKSADVPFVVVLGHPDYYPRFGFTPTVRFAIDSEFQGVPAEAFMILPLDPKTSLKAGVIRYHTEFDVFK